MKKTYIIPNLRTRQLMGEEVLAGASIEVIETETITSGDQIEANSFSVWDDDQPKQDEE